MKTTKKIIALLFVAIFALSCMVVPASAASKSGGATIYYYVYCGGNVSNGTTRITSTAYKFFKSGVTPSKFSLYAKGTTNGTTWYIYKASGYSTTACYDPGSSSTLIIKGYYAAFDTIKASSLKSSCQKGNF